MKNIDPHLLERYAKGQCNAEEQALIEQWLEADEDWFTEESSEEDKESTQDAMSIEIWDALKNRIKKRLWMLRVRWASFRLAGIGMITAIIFFTWPLLQKEQPYQLREIATTAGKFVKFTLPDSSTVWLSGNSKISFPTKFDNKTRLITLNQGEIFIDVQKHRDWPFEVKTDELTIQVLGTQFNVENRLNEHQVYTSLKSGSIKLKNNTQEILLKPGETISYHKINHTLSPIQHANPEDMDAWITGGLIFKGIPLTAALHRLEDFYGVTFKIAEGSNLNLPITGKFKNQSLDRILVLISQTTGLQFKQRGNQILVH